MGNTSSAPKLERFVADEVPRKPSRPLTIGFFSVLDNEQLNLRARLSGSEQQQVQMLEDCFVRDSSEGRFYTIYAHVAQMLMMKSKGSAVDALEGDFYLKMREHYGLRGHYTGEE